MNNMKINAAGLKIIKSIEQCRLTAYPDPATGGVPWTIGWGSTKGVHQGMTITQAEADQRLLDDLAETEKVINDAVKVPLTSNQFSALVSLVFNIGPTNFLGHNLLALINQKKYAEAAPHFLLYDKANGKEMPGLLARRKAEEALFLTP